MSASMKVFELRDFYDHCWSNSGLWSVFPLKRCQRIRSSSVSSSPQNSVESCVGVYYSQSLWLNVPMHSSSRSFKSVFIMSLRIEDLGDVKP